MTFAAQALRNTRNRKSVSAEHSRSERRLRFDEKDKDIAINADQVFAYDENQVESAVIGTVQVADPSEVKEGEVRFAFYANGEVSSVSADGFFEIDCFGAIRMTAAGVAASANDYETSPNSFVYQIVSTDDDDGEKWGAPVDVTLNVNNVLEPKAVVVDFNDVTVLDALGALFVGYEEDGLAFKTDGLANFNGIAPTVPFLSPGFDGTNYGLTRSYETDLLVNAVDGSKFDFKGGDFILQRKGFAGIPSNTAGTITFTGYDENGIEIATQTVSLNSGTNDVAFTTEFVGISSLKVADSGSNNRFKFDNLDFVTYA